MKPEVFLLVYFQYLFASILGIGIDIEEIIKSCVCWEHYEARFDARYNISECYAKRTRHIMPCNIHQVPPCKCSNKSNGILTDEKGVWCVFYIHGHEKRRWACENHDEWTKFIHRHRNHTNLRKRITYLRLMLYYNYGSTTSVESSKNF
ncbi:hypothetical protein ILUMI_09274 [Ignelater luminosus]|uniref:Uncharacterized protein n=1 Tax=Ignelater luminosus TaxID=2038154 RepID=A0A8K0D4K6_IGNLU|nr:hypothetical protein ILUMI_09274 [Ignelater luminosus]